jgi:hypothetical protein
MNTTNDLRDLIQAGEQIAFQLADGREAKVVEYEINVEPWRTVFVLKGVVDESSKEKNAPMGGELTMQEIISRKRDMEKRIAGELEEFEKATGLAVADLTIEKSGMRSMNGDTLEETAVDAEVVLL